MRLRLSLLALILLAGSASARNFSGNRRVVEPPPRAATTTIRFEESRDSEVDRVLRGGGTLDLAVSTVDVAETETGSFVALDLAIGTSSENNQAAAIAIEVPAGARVVGMMLTAGGSRWKAEELTPTEASDRYDREVSRFGDPALLMWKGTGDTERLVLHVAPIRNDSPATVTLRIAMPLSAQLDIVTAGRHRAYRSVRRATDEDFASFANAAVNARVAMYAGPALDPPPSRAEIQRMLRRSRPEFRACYHAAPERDRAHEVVLSFTVGTTGRITSSVENASDTLASCITTEVNSWRFDRNAEPVSVRYPITFVPFGR